MISSQAVPRLVEFKPARSGTPGGDMIHGNASAANLLRPAGPDSDVGTSRLSSVSSAAFTATSERTRTKLDRVLNGDGVLVSTGQQPGLFLGPLYVLYKILSAVAHAQRIEKATGRPAVATFWVAGDDHDWNEVGTARIVSRSGVIETVSILPDEEEAGRAVGPARLGSRVVTILDQFANAAGGSEYAAVMLAPLRRAYVPDATVTAAFQSALADLLQEFDFVLFDPAHEEVRRAAVPFFRRVLEDSDAISRAVVEGTAAVVEAGYEPKLRPPGDGTQVFYDDGRTRSHLLREGTGFRNGKSGDLRSMIDWLSLLEAEPERFSAAAALRPALESWLLPVARTVLGPGELAYWAQLGPLFRIFDVGMPETAPRSSWLLVEPRVERWLRGVDASAEEMADGGSSVERRITLEARPEAIVRGLEQLRSGVEANLAELELASESEIPGLSAAYGKARKSVETTVAALERTIDARVLDSRRTRLDRARRAADLLYPGGQPQERVDSPFSFLVRYGPAFLAALATAHGITDDGLPTDGSVAAPQGPA